MTPRSISPSKGKHAIAVHSEARQAAHRGLYLIVQSMQLNAHAVQVQVG